MPIRFLKREGTTPLLTSVSPDRPLPVHDADRGTEPNAIDTLLTNEISIDGTAKDLMGNTGSEMPTLTRATAYKRFILVGVKSTTTTSADEVVEFRLKGRVSDMSGNDIHSGWLELATVTWSNVPTAAATWFRAVLEPADGKPPGCDIYRIEVQRTAGTESFTFRFSLKGER